MTREKYSEIDKIIEQLIKKNGIDGAIQILSSIGDNVDNLAIKQFKQMILCTCLTLKITEQELYNPLITYSPVPDARRIICYLLIKEKNVSLKIISRLMKVKERTVRKYRTETEERLKMSTAHKQFIQNYETIKAKM